MVAALDFLISEGHSWGDVRRYTLRQLRAFATAAAHRVAERPRLF